MKINRHENRIGTPLGELIAAASEAAFECCDDEKDAYDLTRLFLVEILKSASPGREPINRNSLRNLNVC